MDSDQPQAPVPQPHFFNGGGTTLGIAELFPAIWAVAEDLSNPSIAIRTSALDKLDQMGAARISPLIAYLISTRLNEPDLGLRVRVVKTIGDVLARDAKGNNPADGVIKHISAYTANMRTRQIFGIIQVLVNSQDLKEHVLRILSICPFAGNHLIELANSRKLTLDIRRQAIHLIGQMGILDAILPLERLQIRMESRLNGQQAMPFAPPLGIDDTELLPVVKSTLALLRS